MSLEEIQASPVLKEMSKTSRKIRKLDLENRYGVTKERDMTRAQQFHDVFCRFNEQVIKNSDKLHKMFKAWKEISRSTVKLEAEGLELWTFHDNSQAHVKNYGKPDQTPHVLIIR